MLLVDTGPLVALLCKDDSSHEICVEQTHHFTDELFTTWPVLTEAAWLLRRNQRNVHALFQLVLQGHVKLAHLDMEAIKWIETFLRRFADQNPQLADASLMYLADSQALDTIFTLDRRDFSIYRTNDNRALTIIP